MGFLEDLFNYDDPVARVRRSMSADLAQMRAAASEGWESRAELEGRMAELSQLLADMQRTQAAVVQVLINQGLTTSEQIQDLIDRAVNQEQISRQIAEGSDASTDESSDAQEDELEILDDGEPETEFDYSKTAFEQMIEEDVDALGHMGADPKTLPKSTPAPTPISQPPVVADPAMPTSEPPVDSPSVPEPQVQSAPPVTETEDETEPAPKSDIDPPMSDEEAKSFDRMYDDKGRYQF
jgi:hypothetical protein